MLTGTLFYPVRCQWSDIRTYLFVVLFATGNLILPQLIHMIPSGGRMFLPIYFFTLVASYKFGWKVGLTTAMLSPVLNSVLFGMPPAAILPAILIKSTLLSLMAAFIALACKKISLLHLLFVVLGYQIYGCVIEWVITQNFQTAFVDFTIGIPGMMIQVFGGWWILKKMALYDQQ